MDSKAVILNELCFNNENIRNLNRATALFGKDKYKECYKEVNKNVYLRLLDIKRVFKITHSSSDLSFLEGASVWIC